MTTGVNVSTQLTQDMAQKSFSSMITRLMPNGQAPLFGITSMLESEIAVAPEHGFFTKTLLFPQMQVSAAGQTAGDTTFTVGSTANVIIGMIMRVNSTGENVIINSIVSATQVTVTRSFGTTAAAAIGASVFLYQVGNAYEEASLRPAALVINPVRITNLTQIFRNSWAISGTVQATKMIAGGDNVSENKQDCAAFHAIMIEEALIFGQKSQSVRNGQPIRSMDGAISIISNAANYPSIYAGVPNTTTFGATTNYTQFEAAVDPMFNQTTDPKVANERMLFVGGTAKRVINNIGRLNGTYQMVDGATSWGLQFSTVKTARGTFRIVEHPLMNTNPTWQAYILGLDLSTFRFVTLGNRHTQYLGFNTSGDVAQDNGIDAVGGTLTTEATCVMKNPPANFFGTSITAAAAG